MRIKSSRFERAATVPADEPRAPGPQVVFLGRSNVGKSSLINRLLGVNGLARTSAQPGKTQTINFYRINERWYFVDLPGYGYARVPLRVRESWQPMVEGYLERRRESIALALLLVDSRRDPTEMDGTMQGWLESKEIPYVVAATKTDKLKASERPRARSRLEQAYGARSGEGPIFVSVKSGLGIKELWKHLDHALQAESL